MDHAPSVTGDSTPEDAGPPAARDASTGFHPSAGSVFRFVLATLPFIGMLVLIPFVNRVEPYVLHLPFLLFWIVVWVALTAACMTVVYFTDPANKTGAEA